MRTHRRRSELERLPFMTWDGSEVSQAEIVTWSKGGIEGWFDGEYYLQVPTREGFGRAVAGDRVVRLGEGKFRIERP